MLQSGKFQKLKNPEIFPELYMENNKGVWYSFKTIFGTFIMF